MTAEKLLNITDQSKIAPGPKHRFLGANASLQFYTDIAGYLKKQKERYGDFVLLKANGHPIYLINNVKYLEQILVKDFKNFTKGVGYQRSRVILGNGLITSDGDFHDSQRKMINPAFHKSMIQGYYETVAKCTNELFARWDRKLPLNSILDVEKEMNRLFIAIILDALFKDDSTQELLDAGCEYTEIFQNTNPFLLLNPEKALKLPIPSVKKFSKSKATLDSMLWNIIKKRKTESVKEKIDILTMIMEAEDSQGKKMSDEVLYDEVRTLFSAANDTSSKVMTWAIYSISQSNEVFEKIGKEINTVLGNKFPTFYDYENLSYTKMVINEAMRLYPPVWMLPRTPINDFYLDEYLIKADSSLFLTPFFVQRDEKYFPEPEKFIPERWMEEERKKRPKLSFFPFGAGPRICTGEAFAMFHMVIILSAIFQKYKFALAPNHKVAISTKLTLKPKYGMNMIIERN